MNKIYGASRANSSRCHLAGCCAALLFVPAARIPENGLLSRYCSTLRAPPHISYSRRDVSWSCPMFRWRLFWYKVRSHLEFLVDDQNCVPSKLFQLTRVENDS
ncbi:hypothetical protein LMH87_002673 [Akanthomyces muscarius]|uniref:Uncharacterized protein n=1 Tax=Akanthomyces muscarius TaxID=2231603 RepID=A0A9W8UJH4_AKAMU|nr:hypothetical protein LMH87_002673 [Akanthomyces muscarius]KAJ4148192.1 hypothetical protein LMH87_002673 [Akanthomyces muscarius]